MKQVVLDYHGFTSNQAVSDLESKIFQYTEDHIEFTIITGHGRIRAAIIEFLNYYNLSWEFGLNNEGCIKLYL